MKANTKTLLEKLTEAMELARTEATSLVQPEMIVLPREAYEALYYAAYDAKRLLKTLKEAL